MKTKIILTIINLFLVFICLGQMDVENFDFRSSMSTTNANFYSIKSAADAFFAVHPASDEGGGYSEYMRWMWFWHNKVDNGNGLNPGSFSHYQNAMSDFLQDPFCNGSSYYNKSWEFLGPNTNPYQGFEGIGRITAIAVDPVNQNIVYAGSSSGGIFKTNDISSQNPVWQVLSDNQRLPGFGVNDIAIASLTPTTIYLATGMMFGSGGGYGMGIMKSTDGGVNWVQKNPTQTTFTDIAYRIVVHPTNNNILFALITDKCYKSTDGGDTWAQVFSLPNSIGQNPCNPNGIAMFLRDIEIKPSDPNTIYISSDDSECGLYYNTNNGAVLYRSSDGGINWVQLQPDPTGTHTSYLSIAVTPAEPASLFAAYKTSIGGYTVIRKSIDNGNTWTLVSSPTLTISAFNFSRNTFIVSSTDPNILYIGGYFINKSINGGWSFSSQNSGHVDVRAICFTEGSALGQQGANDIFLVGNDGGILKTSNGGQIYNGKCGTGLSTTQFWGSGINQNGMMAGGTLDNDIIINNNNTWSTPFLYQDGSDVVFDPQQPNVFYGQKWCCSATSYPIIKYEYTSNGWSDTYITQPDLYGQIVRPMEILDNKLYIGYRDVYRTNLPGISWTKISNFSLFPGIPSDLPLSAMAVAPSNSNIIYASFSGPYWGSPRPLFFKTTTGGGTNTGDWVNLTSGLPTDVGQSLSIVKIVVDAENPNRLWMAIGGIADNWIPGNYNGRLRVIKSEDGGVSWTDYSLNLPKFPVNSLIFQKGSKGGIYAATDVGVFYTDDDLYGTTGWICYNLNLPVIMLTDIDIDYCNNKLVAASFGRGMWQCDLITSNSLPLTITTNTTINQNRTQMSDIVVQPNVTLTISCKISFGLNARIIVKPGAKLIIDGGTLTSACHGSWPGIEVWGDYNQSQFTINGQCPQGILVIKNHSLIENAENIAIWRPGYYYTAGGIIQATNSTFKNNRRSTEFISYHNFNPYSPPPRPHLNNYSYFSDCSFEIDNSYLGPNPFYAHVSMWDVEGISFKGCHFSNSKSYSTSIGRGYGIYTIDAGYIIDTYCNSSSTPCPPSYVIRSSFQGLFAGISALNGSSPNTVYINKADFTDNSYGIRLNAVNNATGVLNTFDIGSNTICPNFTGIGIELNNCTGYTIEQNSFTHSGNTNPGENYIGIRVIGQPDPSLVTYNQIYNNSSQGITIGNQAEKNNANSNGTTGLYYICNDNNNNIYDFYVFGPGIAQYQGSYSRPAGNKFSKNANNPYSDFNNQASWTITYKYYNGDPLQFPESIYNIITQGTPNQNLCPDNYGGNGIGIEKLSADQISVLQLEYADNITAYNNIKAMYESLKDGGNTSALSSDINNSTPDQTMQLRDELLGRSPHLSREILVTAANKNDVLPDPILFEILAANPDELRNDSLLNYLKEKTNPLPDYMIELLKAIAIDSTYKTTLQSGLSYYYAKSMNAAYALTHDILLDTVKDYSNLRNWLDNQHSISADYQIIDSWFAEKNTTSALALLNLLPQTYSLDSSATVEYNYYKDFKTFQAALINNNTNIFQLDSAQIAFLDYTASNSKGIAGDEARNILEFAYGVFNINCPPSPDSPVKSAPFNAAKNLNSIYEPKITVTPNPAGSWAVFNYTLLAGVNNSWIKITDMKNQVIKILPITKVEGQITWDTRDIPSGLYIYILMNDKYSKSGKVSVVH